jgi:hypothetical protein
MLSGVEPRGGPVERTEQVARQALEVGQALVGLPQVQDAGALAVLLA